MTIVYRTKTAVYADIEHFTVIHSTTGWRVVGTTKDNKTCTLWPCDGSGATQEKAIQAVRKISDRIYKGFARTDTVGIFIDIPFTVDGEDIYGAEE